MSLFDFTKRFYETARPVEPPKKEPVPISSPAPSPPPSSGGGSSGGSSIGGSSGGGTVEQQQQPLTKFQQDLLIQQEVKNVKGPYTEAGAREKATQNLIYKGVLPEGTNNVYSQPNYNKIYSDINQQENILKAKQKISFFPSPQNATAIKNLEETRKRIQGYQGENYIPVRDTKTGGIQFIHETQKPGFSYMDYARENYYKTKQGVTPEGMLRGGGAAILGGVFNPSYYWETLTKGPTGGAEVIAKWEYETQHDTEKNPVIRWGKTQIMPYENFIIPLATMQGGSYALGYLKGLGPLGAKISTSAGRGLALYTGKTLLEGGREAYKEGKLPEYIFTQGGTLGLLSLGSFKSFKLGETKGFRKRVIGNLESPTEKARITDIYKSIDLSGKLSSKNRGILDLNKVETLKGNIKQQENLIKAIGEAKDKKLKVVLGGSASQSTYGLKTSPHDIDILVKPSKIRPFISDISTGERIIPSIKKYNVSNVKKVENIFRKNKIDLSSYDIHDLPVKGSTFPQLGTGYTESIIKTSKGSIFKYQMQISEQAGRKFASMFAPLHELRGKDWNDALNIAMKKFSDKELVSRLEKWKPELKSGTEELIGKSYYQLHSNEAPQKGFTWFETKIKKYGKPIDTLFAPESKSFIKPGAEPFRPKMINKPVLPDWAKGVTFFSTPLPISIQESKYSIVVIPKIGYGKTIIPKKTIYGYDNKQKYNKSIPNFNYDVIPKKDTYTISFDKPYSPPGYTPGYNPPYKPSYTKTEKTNYPGYYKDDDKPVIPPTEQIKPPYYFDIEHKKINILKKQTKNYGYKFRKAGIKLPFSAVSNKVRF
jgi:hypothetical protein